MSVFILALTFFSTNINCDTMQEVRDDFHQIDTEDLLKTFLKKHENSSCSEATPYVAAATMRMAEYCLWPGSKLSYFSEGKTQLESYIEQNNSCIEGHYVRALVQSQLPSFLGYYSSIQADCDFVKDNISTSGLPQNFQETVLAEINLILKDL